MMNKQVVKIIGAGLAGSEAAWQLAQRGIAVEIYEMRPQTMTKAHTTGLCAELVCSNSFRGAALSNAVGLLKEELKICNSLIIEAALVCQVPAGGALAVDRERFSLYVDQKLKQHPLIEFHLAEVKEVPQSSTNAPVIIATGPLTGNSLAKALQEKIGAHNLAFFDAISPIIHRDSINYDYCFFQSRYDKGGDDYLNIPLNKEQYTHFVAEVRQAAKYTGNIAVESDSPDGRCSSPNLDQATNSIEGLVPFEGCMPIEDMVERGEETLRFGPLKPVGLRDPRSGERPYAVIQLRQDDTSGTLWSMVGMQTRMKRAEQERIFCALPALAKAEFLRFGSVHRNTFIASPSCLSPTLEFRTQPGLFIAGQLTGVEGYVESTAGGLVAGFNAWRLLTGNPPLAFPPSTAIGALLAYISEPTRKNFQPMNVNYGLIESYELTPKRDFLGKRLGKTERRLAVAEMALARMREFYAENSDFAS